MGSMPRAPGHSHSDDIDGDYSEQGCDVERNAHSAGLRRFDLSPPTQGEQQGPITLAVEMAQQGGANTGIKTETLEED
ncbi:hypothetical protein AAFF_G00398190 [Aldrovandia affinis]|uniref:Uncharacterized protein n=1 Tax=Aldrovandia affinis TaxID=143900 RepID=A0AAD7R3Z3_9TELE|nr:hypothetical protein AAFF_G00398190 [Aldrovandia affinis]